MLVELRHYSRLAIGLVQAMRLPAPADPEAFLRASVLNRERSFLDIVKRAIFDRPEHPYLAMFQLAGCEFGDLEAAVLRDGLEPALTRLRREGIYLTHDEFRGKQPIVRAGREIPGTLASFTNPFVQGWLGGMTSGSMGRPVKTTRSAESTIHTLAYQALREREFELDRRVLMAIRPILPSTPGLLAALRARRSGRPLDRWFSPGSAAGSGPYRAMTNSMVLLGNLLGAGAPFPVFLPPNDFAPVARHIARRRAEGHQVAVQGITSPLVRVAGAAVDAGLDISGTLFLSGGEALTPGKSQVIEAAGARIYTSYASSELGLIGAPCRALHGNAVHLMSDSTAVIAYRRPSPYGGDEVDSLHFTTLQPHAPRVLINLEMDDAGELRPATCDCAFSRLGFRTIIANIASFGKMSAQGVTLYGKDLEHILEVELPARLGGGPGDYQLVEHEAANRQTQLRLYVSPRTGITDVRLTSDILMELIRPRFGGALAERHLSHSGGLEAVIAEPLATATGKVHPVRVLGTASRPSGRHDVAT